MNYRLFLKNKKITKEYKLNNKVIIDNDSFGLLFSYKKWVRKTQRQREHDYGYDFHLSISCQYHTLLLLLDSEREISFSIFFHILFLVLFVS